MFEYISGDRILLFILFWTVALVLLFCWHFYTYAKIFTLAVKKALPYTLTGFLVAFVSTAATMMFFSIIDPFMLLLAVAIGLFISIMISLLIWNINH